MKAIIFILYLSILLSCKENSDSDSNDEPNLEIRIIYSWSEVYEGYFSISFYVDNTGGVEVTGILPSFHIYGSKGSLINHAILESDSRYKPIDFNCSLKPHGSTQVAVYPGRGFIYVPYFYEITIYYWSKDRLHFYGPIRKYEKFEIIQ